MKKILIIFGTRPEAIKMAPIVKALKSESAFDIRVCVSAQHREMLDSVLSSFDITPDYDLSIMKQGQTLSYITNEVMSGLSTVTEEFHPDMIMVHGDTTTAFAGALFAFYNHITLLHVEAGLRSSDIHSPFPEEMNRRVISLLANIHFAPTKEAVQNLKKENVPEERIFLVGNSVIDAMQLSESLECSVELPSSPYFLLTIHRREHTDEEILSAFRAVRRICVEQPSLFAIYPIHKNPRFLRLFEQVLGDIENIKLCNALPVEEFHKLLRGCRFVLTDSGGIQEEAAYLGKPVLVLRDNTERPEGERLGTLRLVGCEENNVYVNIKRLLDNDEYARVAIPCYDYGNGSTSTKIVEILKSI